MNTDPPGTDEDHIDVFVLCGNSSDATLLSQQLPPHGYRVTLFTDITHLFENIRAGKPNLLICDATSTEPDGYEFCREIKADYDLWLIPVLLITGVSSLSDLLRVLDSNADNFIARPFDISELLPLIESMIAERVEKPDPEKVKTRFKIRHDNHDYVIMADRRKLLDFLLSSYDLAVNRTQELERVQGKFEDLIEELEIRVKNRTQSLSDEVERLEVLVKEHSRALEQKDKLIHEQEAREKEMLRDLQESEATISRGATSLTKITGELDQSKIRCAEAEEQIRTLTRDKEELARSLQEEIDSLRTASNDIKAELDATKRAHSEALDQISSHEVRHADLANEKDQTETTLRSCSLELDDLKRALAGQKDRATAAERELQSVKQAKAELEQDLQKKVNDLTGKVKEQADELVKQKKVLDAEAERRTAFGQQVQALTQEKEKKEAALVAERESLREQRDALQEKIDTNTASLGAERQKAATLAGELQNASLTNEKILGELRITTRRLEIAETASEEEKQLRLVSEKNAKEALTAKDEAVQSYQKLLASLHEDKKTYNEELAIANRERETIQSTRKILEDELAAAVLARVQSEKFAQSLSHEMELLRAALETERRERRILEENLKEEKLAKDRIEQSLRTVTVEKAHEHDSLVIKLQKLTEDFEKETSREKSLELELAAAVRQQADKEDSAKTLSQEFEQLQAAYKADQEELRDAREQLAEIRDAFARANAKIQPVTKESPGIVPSHALTLKGPDLPRVVEQGKHSLSVVNIVQPHQDLVVIPAEPASPAAQVPDEIPPPDIHCVEDLFEDDPEMDITELPDATIEPEVASETIGADLNTENSEMTGSTEPEEEIVETDTSGEVVKEESVGEETGMPTDHDAAPIMTTPRASTAEIANNTYTEREPEDRKRSAIGTLDEYGIAPVQGSRMFDRRQWFDLVRWAHNTQSLSREEKLRFVRLGRLLQKGRRLSQTQDEQVTELVSLAYSMGFKPR